MTPSLLECVGMNLRPKADEPHHASSDKPKTDPRPLHTLVERKVVSEERRIVEHLPA